MQQGEGRVGGAMGVGRWEELLPSQLQRVHDVVLQIYALDQGVRQCGAERDQ